MSVGVTLTDFRLGPIYRSRRSPVLADLADQLQRPATVSTEPARVLRRSRSCSVSPCARSNYRGRRDCEPLLTGRNFPWWALTEIDCCGLPLRRLEISAARPGAQGP